MVICGSDEDTFAVIWYEATDIDSPISSLKTNFIGFLDNNVPNHLLLCDGIKFPNDNTTVNYDACQAHSALANGDEFSSPSLDGHFGFVFVHLLVSLCSVDSYP